MDVLPPISDVDFNGDGLSDLYARYLPGGFQLVGLSNGVNDFNTLAWDIFAAGVPTNLTRTGRRS